MYFIWSIIIYTGKYVGEFGCNSLVFRAFSIYYTVKVVSILSSFVAFKKKKKKNHKYCEADGQMYFFQIYYMCTQKL